MNKVLLSIVIGAFLFPITGQAETLSEALLKCSREQNSLKRLVCFDGVTKDVKQFEDGERPSFVIPSYRLSDNNPPQAASAPAPRAPVPVPQATPPTNPVQNAQGGAYRDEDFFGLPNELTADNIKKLYMTITKLKEGPRERLIFTFNNGQVWRQTDYERFNADVGDVVYVERGAIGSFWLSGDNVRKRIRVRRDNPTDSPSNNAQRPESRTVYAQATSPPVAENRDDDAGFGLPEVDKGTRDRDIKVYMAVADVIEGKDDRVTVIFENGQIWKQTDTTDLDIAVGQIAYVESGSLGSFWLSTDDTKKRIRVRRTDRGNTRVVSRNVPTGNANTNSESATTTEDRFGLPEVTRKKEDKDTKVYMTVAKVRKNKNNKLIFTFDNGQIWRQTDVERFKANEGDVVYITRGSFGSFWLSMDDVKKRIRVKRDS